jgi:hypothetical protein
MKHITNANKHHSNLINIFMCYEFQSKRNPRFFWISAAAPLTSVVLASILVYLTRAENHGVQVVIKILGFANLYILIFSSFL